MDQDLSLMEQLLTLNDRIEEVKHKYMYSVSKDSLGASSCNLSAYCDFTDSDMSLASLDVNDYNEDCLFGSDLDIRTKRTVTSDDMSESLNELQQPVEKHELAAKEAAEYPEIDFDKNAFNLDKGHKRLQGASKETSEIPRRASELSISQQTNSAKCIEKSTAKYSDKTVLSSNADCASKLNDTRQNFADLSLSTVDSKSNQDMRITEMLTHTKSFNENSIPTIVVSDFVTDKPEWPLMIGSQQRERETRKESCSLQEFTNDSENVENVLGKLFQTSFSKDSGFEDDNFDRKHLG